MKTQKMSLANIQGKLSRDEMKNIMAGVASGGCSGQACDVNDTSSCCSGYSCWGCSDTSHCEREELQVG